MRYFSKGLMVVTIILMLLIVFVDKDILNSLFIHYEKVDISESLVVNVDNNRVVYHDTGVKSVGNGTTNNSNASSTKVVSSVSRLWTWPTDKNYTITTYYSNFHKAIDIYSYTGYGSNIYAANNGTVSMVMGGCVVGNLSCNGRGGNYVIIRHSNNYYTVYMHLKDIRVRVGQNVNGGQVIGTMGNTGNVVPVPTSRAPYLGTHLHFAVYVGEPYRGGYTINPMKLY